MSCRRGNVSRVHTAQADHDLQAYASSQSAHVLDYCTANSYVHTFSNRHCANICNLSLPPVQFPLEKQAAMTAYSGCVPAALLIPLVYALHIVHVRIVPPPSRLGHHMLHRPLVLLRLLLLKLVPARSSTSPCLLANVCWVRYLQVNMCMKADVRTAEGAQQVINRVQTTKYKVQYKQYTGCKQQQAC